MRLFRRSAYAVSHGNPPTPTELWARLEVASANIAHRCGGFRAPENTLEALRQAHADGAVAVEIDVCLSSDNVPHVIHDATVDRTTDGRGLVRGFSAEGLRKLNAAAKFVSGGSATDGTAFPAARIPTLDELVDEALRLKLGVFIDCKDARTAAHVAAMFKRNALLYETGCVVSFNPFTLRSVRRLDERIPIMLTHKHQVLSASLTKKKESGCWKLWLAAKADSMLSKAIHDELWLSLKACGVLLWKDDITESVVDLWRARGMKVIAWTVNRNEDKERLRLLNVPCMTDSLTEEEAPEAD